jgi:hypothetical protein
MRRRTSGSNERSVAPPILWTSRLASPLSRDGRSHPRDERVNSRIRAYTHMSAIARRDVWASGELPDGYGDGEVPENWPRNFDRDASRSLELPICSGLFQPGLLSNLQHPTRMVCQGCLGERVRPQNKGRNSARRRGQKAARGRRLNQLEHETQVSLRNLRTLDCVRKTEIHFS